jgi:hypothetical protein
VYDDARIVHMVRDPRDRYADALAGRGVGHGGVGAAIRHWRESVTLALDHAAAWPDRYLVVRFEDLALDPDATLRRVLDLIGEPAPSAPISLPAQDGLAAAIGGYRRLSGRTIAMFETSCAVLMRRLGYAPSSPRLTAAERLALAVIDRPRASATGMLLRLAAARELRRDGLGAER